MKEGTDPESKYQTTLLYCLEAIKKAIPSKHNKAFSTNIQSAIGN